MSISIRGNKAVLAGTSKFGLAPSPRLTVDVGRLVLCPSCRRPLEAELTENIEGLSGHPFSVAMGIYDSNSDFRHIQRAGSTILITNRHLGSSAPASRQCSGGFYVGRSPQGLYATLWQWCADRVTGNGAFASERDDIRVEVIAAEEEERATNLDFPPPLDRLFSDNELNGKKPVEPLMLLKATSLFSVISVRGKSQQDGVVYLIDRIAFEQEFASPYAPELLVSKLGGIGELRRPCLSLPSNGLLIKTLKGELVSWPAKDEEQGLQVRRRRPRSSVTP